MYNICEKICINNMNNITPYLPDEKKQIFFDIETTGFSSNSDICYLIGVVYNDKGTIKYNQWFADTPREEEEIIRSFCIFLDSCTSVIHFNGDGFDIPFITERGKKYGIALDFSRLESIDLLKHTRNIRNLLRLENYKQKTLERFLEINREDKYSGGELINIYKRYNAFKEPSDRDLLLLHNRDDILGMLPLYSILSYENITNKNFVLKNITLSSLCSKEENITKDGVTNFLDFTLGLSVSVPKQIITAIPVNNMFSSKKDTDSFSTGNEMISILIKDDLLKISVPVYNTELKHFYSDYKNYFYLPEEDKSIHKSVGAYVDSSFKEKAKKENCYVKNVSSYIPVPLSYEDKFLTFRKSYNDNSNYLELNSAFLNDKNAVFNYISDIIDAI
ncbi:MAG: ribonuclease H-like domain-containing protein [Eubacteriales bacterium]|nr:ribonuclease H-like domain-containing protein [Eubacteriales bacterium]